MIVSAIPVEDVVNTAKKVLYTGHYGDGKISIYDVEDVVKIRTGETGFDAMQDYPIQLLPNISLYNTGSVRRLRPRALPVFIDAIRRIVVRYEKGKGF